MAHGLALAVRDEARPMSRKKHRAMRSATSEQCDNVSDRGVTGSQIKTEYALIAQSVEHAAVNRGVTGSSPVWGAK